MRKKKQKEDKTKEDIIKTMFNIPQTSPQKLSLTPFINPFENSKLQSRQTTPKDYSNLPTPPSFLREYKRCDGGTIDDFVNINSFREMAPEARLNQKVFSTLSSANNSQPIPEFSRIPRTSSNQQNLVRSNIYIKISTNICF